MRGRKKGQLHTEETKRKMSETAKRRGEQVALADVYIARKRVVKAIDNGATVCEHLAAGTEKPLAMVHGDDPTSLLCGACYERVGKVRFANWSGKCDLCERRKGNEQLTVALGEVMVTFHACVPCCKGWALLVELESDEQGVGR